MKRPVVLVHPDNVNLADAKALAALHGASVVGNPFVPRGTCYLTDEAATDFAQHEERP